MVDQTSSRRKQKLQNFYCGWGDGIPNLEAVKFYHSDWETGLLSSRSVNPPIADDGDEDRDLGKHFVMLERQDRIALVESLERGSSWNIDFGVMLGCSVFIAGLGLLQDSVAVIIGAMLVAPLMTPLVGIGLALIQGNFKLLRVAWKSMTIGVLISLAIGISLRWVIPGDELTMEITGRGYPNMLDLLIAFFAGVAGGYALARPELSGALPGVAIAVSLIPPLAASGIALGIREWHTAGGALLLFFTNMVAIYLVAHWCSGYMESGRPRRKSRTSHG